MHGRNPQVERLGNGLIRRPFCGSQQHMSACNLARRRFAFMDYVQQVFPLLFSQINQIFVGHGVSSC
jgi:hypothetical protein